MIAIRRLTIMHGKIIERKDPRARTGTEQLGRLSSDFARITKIELS
jgi:hypothetical protein